MSESTYQGSYAQLRGVPMSDAYASTLHISFDVRGGLLMRQMHHWSAMLFIAAMFVHMMRVFLTGAFRKPRELNWVIGSLLLLLGILEGFAGYSLPDDLLSGTGLRIADGLIKATPVVGTYMSFFLFGGEFPGDVIIPRLYTVHVLLIPGLLLALIGAAHAAAGLPQAHPVAGSGPHRAERRRLPDAPGLHGQGRRLLLHGLRRDRADGGAAVDQPGLEVRAVRPVQVTAGSQPDWYMGIAEGLLRIMPNWETPHLGHTISWNVLIPGPDRAVPAVRHGHRLAVPRAVGDRRQARAPPAPAAAQRADPDGVPGRDGGRLRPALGCRWQRHPRHPAAH